MKLLIAYNFVVEEAHVEMPNFYKSCAEKIFPEYFETISYLPNFRRSILFKILSRIKMPADISLATCLVWWLIKNGDKYDVIVGWVTNGIIAASIRKIIFWHHYKVCLILYRITDSNPKDIIIKLKNIIMLCASKGTAILMTLDDAQTASFEKLLKRPPGTTKTLIYGIDTEWYDSKISISKNENAPITLFCPGSAYRDDLTLARAVWDQNVLVKRYQLDNSIIEKTLVKKNNRSTFNYIYNAKSTQYLQDCINSTIVVVSVLNNDKPVGLTSILECMYLGKPVIATKGVGSRAYIQEGVTGFLFDYGCWEELREKIIYLIRNPLIAEKIGKAGKEKVSQEYELHISGRRFMDELKFLENTS